MAHAHKHVEGGKMMSADAIQFKKKVFAFIHEEKMTFKLGKGFDLNPYGITDYAFLSPFKNKPPMKAWFVVSSDYQDQWPVLAERALLQIQKELG